MFSIVITTEVGQFCAVVKSGQCLSGTVVGSCDGGSAVLVYQQSLIFKSRPNKGSIHNNTAAHYIQPFKTSTLQQAELSGSLPRLPIAKITSDEAMTPLSNVLVEK